VDLQFLRFSSGDESALRSVIYFAVLPWIQAMVQNGTHELTSIHEQTKDLNGALSYFLLLTLLGLPSSNPFRSFRRIQHLVPLHDPDLCIIHSVIQLTFRILRPLRNALVVAARIDT
jgi:hypothetical protein